MRVLLINPDQRHAVASEAGDLPRSGSGPYPPLGLLYLQAALEAETSHRAEILDANLPGELGRLGGLRIAGAAPDLVGVTALTPNLPGVLHALDSARRAFPRARVVLGGPHVDLFPREAAALEGVDFVLRGEAEQTLPALVAALEGGERAAIPGLVTSETFSPVTGEGDDSVPRVGEIDSLPLPDRSRLPLSRYRGIGGEDVVFTSMLTSRGCPYRCRFCSTPGGRYRFRSAEAIVDEMRRCARLGIGHVYFVDDNFPTAGRRLRALCEAMLRERALPRWSCRTAAAGLSESAFALMKRAGCIRVQIGVETGSEEGLRVLGKQATVEQLRETFVAARRAGIATMAYFMIGLPVERTPKDVRRLIRFAQDLGPTYAMFNVLTLYPGTELFADAVGRGLVDGELWRRFAACPEPGFLPPIWDEFFDRAELAALQREAYRRFYLRPGVLWRELVSGGSLARKVRAGLELLRPARSCPEQRQR